MFFYYAAKEKKKNSKYKININFELNKSPQQTCKHREPTQTQDTAILWKYMSLSKTITFGYFSIGKSIILTEVGRSLKGELFFEGTGRTLVASL